MDEVLCKTGPELKQYSGNFMSNDHGKPNPALLTFIPLVQLAKALQITCRIDTNIINI